MSLYMYKAGFHWLGCQSQSWKGAYSIVEIKHQSHLSLMELELQESEGFNFLAIALTILSLMSK